MPLAVPPCRPSCGPPGSGSKKRAPTATLTTCPMRLPGKCGSGLWFGAQFLTPLSGGIGVQNPLEVRPDAFEAGRWGAESGDEWPDTPGAFSQRELHEGANQIPWLVW